MENLLIKTQKSIIATTTHIRYAQFLANDKSHDDIAKELGIKKRTIEARWQRCKKLFKVKTKPGLVALLLKEGLIKAMIVMLPVSGLSQRVIIEQDLDTLLIPLSCPITIKTYKPPTTANKPPVAVLVTDTSIRTPNPTYNLQLDASRSYDPEGGVLRFFWRQTSGATSALLNTTKSIATVNLGVGIYSFEVRVVDPMNAFVAKNVIVKVVSEK